MENQASQQGLSRQYHDTDSPYSLPNDEREHVRLEAQSDAIILMLFNKPFHASVTGAKKVLEIGCGTGAMTRRLASQYPEARVYGIDLSPPPAQPSSLTNLEFIVADFNVAAFTDQRLQDSTFDYIYSRMLVGGIDDWPAYIRACFRLLKPGGLLELQDLNCRWFDMYGRPADSDWRWLQTFNVASERVGLDTICGFHHGPRMNAAGFEDIHEEEFVWGFGDQPWEEYPHSEPIRIFTVSKLLPTLELLIAKVCERANMKESASDMESLQEAMRATLPMQKGGHCKYSVVWGQKPRTA